MSEVGCGKSGTLSYMKKATGSYLNIQHFKARSAEQGAKRKAEKATGSYLNITLPLVHQ